MTTTIGTRATCCIAFLLAACAAPPASCPPPQRVADLPAPLDETSGIAVSRSDPGTVWAHNDSEGSPMLYAIARDGRLIAEIALTGAGTQSDWEDIAVGPCPDGHCLYIADIGDNLHDRDDRAILRIAEPDPRAAAAAATGIVRLPFAYPEGPEDAEAIFVMPDTTLYIITKGRSRPATLYRYPPPLRPDVRVALESVQVIGPASAQLPDLVTGADATPDGRRIAVRTYHHITFHRFAGDTLVSVSPRLDLESLAEPQGEAVAFAGGDTLLHATEAGLASARPFLGMAHCATR
jgi:hypothetical protein